MFMLDYNIQNTNDSINPIFSLTSPLYESFEPNFVSVRALVKIMHFKQFFT